MWDNWNLQVCSWLNERNAVALDESWRDPINLQAKLLKHQSFEAEILANRNRVDTLTKVCVKKCFQCTLITEYYLSTFLWLMTAQYTLR